VEAKADADRAEGRSHPAGKGPLGRLDGPVLGEVGAKLGPLGVLVALVALVALVVLVVQVLHVLVVTVHVRVGAAIGVAVPVAAAA
jgi:hypothetical protein